MSAAAGRKKEDRSDWVAVEPEFTSADQKGPPEIRKASSAYQFFQKNGAEQITRELRTTSVNGKVNIADFGRLARDKWQSLSSDDKDYYETLARQDNARFARESHVADVAAMERREKLRNERSTVLLDVDDGGVMEYGPPQRTTRKGLERKHRKQAKAEKRQHKKKGGNGNNGNGNGDGGDEDDFVEDDESDSGSFDSEVLSDETDDTETRRKKKKPVPRQMTEKQIENRDHKKQEKLQKEQYIAGRQEDLRKEKAGQAQRRLEFLLKQSNIFSHFGSVKEDTAKFGIKTAPAASKTPQDGEPTSRRGAADGGEDGDEDLDEVDEHEATRLTTQPSTLGHGQMRGYQLEGLNWMIRLQETGLNGILADEMGLGKTLQSISILVYMLEYQNITGPHLIVVPKSTLSNWMNEIARWAPTLKPVKFHGDKASREAIVNDVLKPGQRDEERDWHLVVTTYEICNIEKNALNKFAWSYLIIDEAHRLKNEASAFSKNVRQFETRYRILLTGTPLQNSLHELWALLNFLIPDVFESADQFDEWFNLDIEDNDEKNKLISQLHKILRPFMLRRLKADVEKSLPPKHETILFTGMSVMQKKLYRDILIRDIDAIQGKSTGGSRTAILNIVMQLRKCAGHPYLFPGVEDRTLPPLGEHLVENCGKMVVLDKLLRRLHETGHRVLLFTQMTKILDIMEDYLVMRRFQYCRIDGNTTQDDREGYIDSFNAPDSEKFIFLLSTRAGGLGINLQTADIVILYDSDWNPQADLQAQDRAHRIGQKRAVQVFRLVTEHTIEEKIVERAQQKLKLDAMVVQQGRLKDKDKLSSDELLAAVRFGADKIFKSKDSSITDDDIDLILNQGKQKTKELNDKLQTADKGDLLDFKLDGSSVQTFEGVDYSKSALAQAKAEAEMLGVFDIGKRERREANYNENSLYHQQIANLQGNVVRKPKKKKEIRLPRYLRLPRMEEWQMYDRPTLMKIQEEEESAFKELPEEEQKKATTKSKGTEVVEAAEIQDSNQEPEEPFELPPLISEERQAEKTRLLAEGFSTWNRRDYSLFIRASARFGRHETEKIALDVGRFETEVREFATEFWGKTGESRVSEHEYDRVTKLIERGEKKIGEINGLERATSVLVAHFENPWQELEFTHVNCKDKMFTIEEDRHLLCWTRKYGYGQWQAIKTVIRRNPNFRFDYFLRSLPVDLLGRRCEQLMRAAEKEVEALERRAREDSGLPTEPETEGVELPPIELPKFRVMEKQRRLKKKAQAEIDRKQLKEKVDEIEIQMRQLQDRLKSLNDPGNNVFNGSTRIPLDTPDEIAASEKENESRNASGDVATIAENDEIEEVVKERDGGAAGPGGDFVEFAAYDGQEPPHESKKPFTHFCVKTRKDLKASLDQSERKDKNKINGILKQRWIDMPEDEKHVWREWAEWDKKRFAHEMAIFENGPPEETEETPDEIELNTVQVHIPKKKRKSSAAEESTIPKKRKE